MIAGARKNAELDKVATQQYIKSKSHEKPTTFYSINSNNIELALKSLWINKKEQYETINGQKFLISLELKPIFETIEKSKSITLLKKDWDERGSIGYTEKTWSSAASFLMQYATDIHRLLGYSLDIPKIYPGPEGSIDIYWETKTYRFVINIAQGGEYASYYIDNHSNQKSEGEFNPSEFNIHLLPTAIQI